MVNLEKANLVERYSDNEHGRRRPTRLTGKGARIVSDAHLIAARTEHIIADAISPLEAAEAEALLQRIRDALQARARE
ncbi:hypothetical protein HFO21_25855 [Rhizobium laguerreae]|uniref:hypothetical protein n=1 Tax=Rhizobium laguerreae TaxID=1076926 RepID=UPI001C9182AC|nr:hypothetical protein [Rhizobium laguerreae]MBY3217743.1 hypothetical protein [Rhizobium laguerreae]